MQFVSQTQEELKQLNLNEDQNYTIQYLNRDYFNGEENIELAQARVIINEEEILFIVTDPYGMDKFIKEARIIK